MAERYLLKFRNLDLTKDINDRLGFVLAGVFEGGDVVPVPGQLKVDVEAPWKLIGKDGMVVIETSTDYRFDVLDGQVTVIAVRVVYRDNDDPIVSAEAIEESAFNLLPNKDEYVIFAKINVPLGAVQVLSDYIETSERDILDKAGRNILRGVEANSSLLPTAKDNVVGDLYVVTDGTSTHIWGWSGSSWIILTDAATAMADLTAHRNNLFVDEKHLTDSEKDAVVGTSGTAVSAANRLIDNADTRIPTQAENDALQGSDGAPGGSNRYVTEEYPLAVPEEKELTTAPTGASVELVSGDGPFYTGRLGLGSADVHFRFYDRYLNREYTTAAGAAVLVDGVYTDAGLTAELDPSLSPNVDADGFFSGASLYVKFDTAPDTGLRLLYGKRRTWGTYPVDGMTRRNVNDAQTSSDAITTVEAIKGRDWDDTPPLNEQNIELRKDIVDHKEYLSAVFKADHVIWDFSRVENVPDFGDDFPPNIGIPPNYSFENSGLEGYNYSSATATVTYNNPVTLGSVVAGHVFLDGAGNEYEITSVPDNQNIVIQRRSGDIPAAIDTTSTDSAHGSCKPDNNPRKINLATWNYSIGRERISCRELEAVLDEYHLRTGNVAFQIRTPLVSAYYREPRVRFYGGFQNDDSGTRARVRASSTGIISITGFFTHVHLLVDLMNASPVLTVKVDGDPVGTTIDTSRSGTVASLGTESDIQQQQVVIATGLADAFPHTVEIEIADAADDFIIHGIDLFRLDTASVQVLPGRAFVQADLAKKDAITTFAGPQAATRSRGVVSAHYINRSLVPQTQTESLTDMDGAAGGPAGNAVPGTTSFTVGSGLVKFQNYREKDIVKLVTATAEEVKQIDTIGPGVGQLEFTTNVTSSGAAILIHVAGTSGCCLDPSREFNRYTISELGTRQDTDFSILFFAPDDRIYTTEDGTTSMAGKNVKYVTTGIDGVDVALECIDATSVIRIRAAAVQLDLLVANSSPASADFALDGSPVYPAAIPGGGLTRIPGWTNARYQTHELEISNAAGIRLAGIIMHEPTLAGSVEGTLLAVQNVVADYDSSLSTDGSVIAAGAIGVDPFKMGGVFVDGTGIGTGWATDVSFAANPWWGRRLETDLEGSYFEYVFLGSGFELDYAASNNKGIPQLFLNGILATLANFPAASFTGMNPTTGEVDMYDASAIPVRKKFSISGLPYGFYTFRMIVKTPRARNASSFGFFINAGTFYEVNDGGRLSVTPSRGFRGKAGVDDFVYGLDWARDARNFDSGAVVKEEVPVFRTVIQDTRAQRSMVPAAATSAAIAFSEPFRDADYSVTCTFSNQTDPVPEFRPVLITNQTASGFTAEWNDPLESGNYFLNYTAIKNS